MPLSATLSVCKDINVIWSFLAICICSLFAILFCPIYNIILRTSLSKVHNLIERFSEDIDLILDWRVLGYKKDEPWQTAKKWRNT